MTLEMTPQHPLLTGAAECSEVLHGLIDANPSFLTVTEMATAITQYAALEAQVHELRLRIMATAHDVIDASAYRSMADWLAAHAGAHRATGARESRMADALTDWTEVAAAMREGRVTSEQAGVIITALTRLPDELEADQCAEAERYLIEKAATFGPHDLRLLGEKLLEVIAPDTYDALEARRLARQEENARTGARLTLTARGDGLTQISGRIPDAVAIRFSTYLQAFTNPRRPENQTLFETSGGLSSMPYPQRAAEAFGQLLETWDPQRLPVHGGDSTTLMVTITLDQLRSTLATATLLDAPDDESEHRITAGDARRLACRAAIIPVVLGTNSEVLDQGRATRLFTRAQQRALVVRDRTCRTEGCHVPGTWAEAHHWIPWTDGGATDLENAVLLCSHHHHLVHSPQWRTERLTNGDVRFQRRE